MNVSKKGHSIQPPLQDTTQDLIDEESSAYVLTKSRSRSIPVNHNNGVAEKLEPDIEKRSAYD